MQNIVTEKKCPRCNKTKSFSEFYRGRSKNGLKAWCKLCENELGRKNSAVRRKEHPEIVREYHDRDWKKNGQRRLEANKGRKMWLKIRYGMEPSEYFDLLEKQEGKCAICKIDQDEQSKAMSVDHDHATGKIRGLLCSNCNIGIGNFQDKDELLFSAYEYLKRASCEPL